MRIYKNLCLSAAVIISLTSCDGSDKQSDAGFTAKMSREAMCVAASENFFLYDQAERHLRHGIDAAKERLRLANKPSDFYEKTMPIARQFMDGMSKEFNAAFLKTSCDTKLTKGDFAKFYRVSDK